MIYKTFRKILQMTREKINSFKIIIKDNNEMCLTNILNDF